VSGEAIAMVCFDTWLMVGERWNRYSDWMFSVLTVCSLPAQGTRWQDLIAEFPAKEGLDMQPSR
jgi:hypothetical protein